MPADHSTSITFPAGCRLTLVSHERRQIKGRWWAFATCRCECGAVKEFYLSNILRGLTTSCGCLGRRHRIEANLTHGVSNRAKVYVAWIGMRNRCSNKNSRSYPNYGGRGIKVCDRWREFTNFYADIMALLPPGSTDIPKHLTLERMDNDGDYEPGNVSLETQAVQNRNKRNNIPVTVDGETKLVVDWCKITGVKPGTARLRIKMGWDKVRAITQPSRRRR